MFTVTNLQLRLNHFFVLQLYNILINHQDHEFHGKYKNMDGQGCWTTRRYVNLQNANLQTSQLPQWTSCGLENSRTSQLVVDAGNKMTLRAAD